MERGILLWCVLAPLAICSGASLLASRVPRLSESRTWLSSLSSSLAIVGWTLAVWLALWGRQGISWPDFFWPAEAWQRVIGPIALVSLLLSQLASRLDRWPSASWLGFGLGANWIAFAAMPTGDGWQDAVPLHRWWIFLVSCTALLNLHSLQSLANSSAERWMTFAALAGLAGPTMLAATVYGGLAEWLLSACAATLSFALFSLFLPNCRLWMVAYPATLFAAAGTASARFYNYEELPGWLYMLILLIPTLIAWIDYPLRARSIITRFVAAATVASSALLVIGWTLFASQESEW